MSAITVYRFTANMIRQNNLTQFLHRFDLNRPEAWHYLPRHFGRLCFSFEGFESNWSFPAELRRFWRVLHECWPHWTLFLDLGQQDLKVMTLGSLKSFRMITIPGQTNGAIFFDRDELDAFIEEDFRRTFECCQHASRMKRRLFLRRKEVLAYFREPLHPMIFVGAGDQTTAPIAGSVSVLIRRRSSLPL